MRWLLPLLGLTFALAGAAAAPAQALSEPASTKLRALTPSELKALIADIDAQGLNTSGTSNVKKGVGRMQLAAGRFGTLSALSTVTIAATGSVVVWKIAEAAGLGDFVYRKITGESFGGTMAPGTIAWESYCALGTSSGGNCSNAANLSAPFTVDTASVPILPAWVLKSSLRGESYCDPASECHGTWQSWATMALAVSGTQTAGATNTTCQSDGSGTCYIKYRSDTEMAATVTVEPSDAAEFASPPGGATTRTAGQADATISDPELEAALDAIDPNPGSAGTAVEEDTAVAILDEIDPGWDQGFLLQPLPNETYTAYITRLQAAGWLGDATSTELATETPGYGPEAVVRVIATPSGGTTTVYDPLNWPSPAPTIDLNSDITIRYNPNTAPEAPTTSTPTTIAVPPTTVPSAPSLDFTPLTDIDFGCKFPYGFLCYAVDFSEQFDVAADAPVFTFDMEMDVALGSFDLGTYEVDLDVMDAWMALWRDILSVVMVVGAIYFVATRMLGFKAGGDPGAAMDDVL